ncbi:MAG: hypothetical protein KAJ55_00435 [Anaerolineales bacterium]|nr:hypothetical protein [Anaerolineales bacterium]
MADLSNEWIKHLPDWPNKCAGKVPEIVKEADTCECQIRERHTHCPGCGRVVSQGSGETIATFKMQF